MIDSSQSTNSLVFAKISNYHTLSINIAKYLLEIVQPYPQMQNRLKNNKNRSQSHKAKITDLLILLNFSRFVSNEVQINPELFKVITLT